MATTYGTVRPWRGYFFVGDTGGDVGGGATWCIHTPWGHFHYTNTVPGEGTYHNRAPWQTTQYGLDSSELVTVLEGGQIAYQPGGAGIITMLAGDGSSVYLLESYDDGETYVSMSELFPGKPGPFFHGYKRDGLVLAACFDYDSGSSGSGKIYGKTRAPGESSFGSEFTFKNTSGTAISFEDVQFSFTLAPEGHDRLTMMATKAGGTGPTFFYSADEGNTWTEV